MRASESSIQSPSVGIVILNWNNFEDTNSCISSAKKLDYNEYDIFLVDNGSIDNSLSRLKNEHPDIGYLELPDNFGYARGMNRGIMHCQSLDYDYIMLCNNDVEFIDQSLLYKLLQPFNSYPELGAVSPSSVQEKKSVFILEFLKNVRVGVTRPSVDVLQNPKFRWPVTYACVLFPTKVIDEIGLLPEHYFMYCEDLAHISKLEKHGYWGAELLDADIKHAISNSSDDNDELVAYYITRNKFLLYRDENKYLPAILLPYYLYYALSRAIYNTIFGNNRKAKSFILGFIDGIMLKQGRGKYP